ncbi:syntaxin-1A isoform X2 [Anabrus simplex]|uniref:syntaxin-1A isoform X2 n=1 Tax=Anabrus simplex TaxID=316456 RepID=UPI0034DD81DF
MPVRDRLPELRASLQWNSKPEPVIVLLGENLQDINAYLSEVEMVREMLDTIKTNTSEIRRLYSIMLSYPGRHHEANSEVLTRREIVEKTIRNVHNKLKSLESSVDETSAPTLYRIQCIQNAAHIRMFKQVTENYHQVLLNYKDKCTALIKRQLSISNRNEELEELIEKDSAIFVDNIIADTLQAQLQLSAVKSRHEDLLKIENSIREMRDMFVNLAILVEQQGEQLNCIRYLVEHAEGYTDHGRTRLEKAKRRAKKRRRRCRKIKIAIAIVVIIMLLILLGQFV